MGPWNEWVAQLGHDGDGLAGLVNAAIKVTVLMIIALGVGQVLRRAPARARYRLWVAAVCGVFAVPVFSALLPAWHVQWLPPVRLAETPVVPGVQPAREPSSTAGGLAPIEWADDAGFAAGGALNNLGREATIPWSSLLLGSWIAGGCIALWPLLLGLARGARCRRRAESVRDPNWRALLAFFANEVGLAGRIELKISPDIDTPMTSGVVRPVVLLPAGAEQWSAERRRIVLLHELIHVQRRDWLILVASRLACALHWFNPLVWIVARQLSVDRERACDQAVIERGTRPSVYAAHLLELAQFIVLRRKTGPEASLAMVQQPSQLEKRIMSICNHTATRRRGLALSASLSISMAASAILLGVIHPSPAPDVESNVSDETIDVPQGLAGRSPVSISGTMTDVSTGDHFVGSFSNLDIDEHGNRIVRKVGRLNGDYVIKTTLGGDIQYDLKIHGQVEFNDDGTAIEELEPDAVVLLRTARGETSQQVLIRADDDGELQYDYTVNGRHRNFDHYGREWMDLALEIGAAIREASDIRGQVSTLKGKISAIKGQRSALRGQISAIKGQRSAFRGQISAAKGQRSALNGQISAIKGQRSGLKGRISGLKAQLSQLKHRKVRLKKTGELNPQELDRLEAKAAEIAAQMSAMEDQIQALDVEGLVSEIKDQIAELDVEGKVRAIQDQIDAFDVAGKVRVIETQVEALQIEDRVIEIKQAIEALDAEERISDIKQRSQRLVDKLDRLLDRS